MTARGAELANEATHRRHIEHSLLRIRQEIQAGRHELRISMGDANAAYCHCGWCVFLEGQTTGDEVTVAYRAHLKDES